MKTISHNNKKGLLILLIAVILKFLFPYILLVLKPPFLLNLIFAAVIPVIFIYGLITLFSRDPESTIEIERQKTKTSNIFLIIGSLLLVASFILFFFNFGNTIGFQSMGLVMVSMVFLLPTSVIFIVIGFINRSRNNNA